MATLQKFKLLATQCAIAGSPTRSPSTSPVIHLRRRKTLRMLLSRTSGSRRWPARDRSPNRQTRVRDSTEKGKDIVVSRHKLKDLFVSSPSIEERISEKFNDVSPVTACSGGGGVERQVGPRSLRPLSVALRQRLLRRPWRPVLVSIPHYPTL